MCTTWFQITYCEACNAYIDSHLVGTVFCGRHDENLPCEVEKAIGETAVPGPCGTCQPPPRLRRSRRLWLQGLENPTNNVDECSDEETTDEDTDDDIDESSDTDTDGDNSQDGDYVANDVTKNDGKGGKWGK